MASNDHDSETSDLPWALTRPSSKSNSKADLRRNVNPKYKVDELNEPPPRLPGIRALLPLPGGDLLTGGTDLKIRRWEHYRFVFVVCSLLIFCSHNLVSNWPQSSLLAALIEVIAFVDQL